MEKRRIGAKMLCMVEEARERRRVAEVFGAWKWASGATWEQQQERKC